MLKLVKYNFLPDIIHIVHKMMKEWKTLITERIVN